MKNTKRLVSLFLSGIIIFSLVSCGLTDNIKNKMIDSDSKNTFSYAVYAIFIFFVVVSFTKQNAVLNLVDSDVLFAETENTDNENVSVFSATPSLASRIIEYPWQESEDYYTYQNTGDRFSVQIQDGENEYQLSMAQGTLQGFGDATPILDTDVYFYVTENGYVAKWQYKDFVVSLISNESLSTFIRKVEIIMEENLT